MPTTIPLTPTTGGGQCIAISALAPADIIVSTTAATVSGVIRGATGSQVSHAMIYAGGGQVIEAIGEGGVVNRPLSAALADATLAVAYRHRNVGRGNASAIIGFARQWVGRRYDTSGAAGAGIAGNGVICLAVGIVACAAAKGGKFNNRDEFFCSELVLEAFRRAGAPITNVPPSTSSPQHIVRAYSQGQLQYVGHLKA